jgi:hypothetical protein
MILSEQQRLQRIIQLFDRLFLDAENTQLIGGCRRAAVHSFIV